MSKSVLLLCGIIGSLINNVDGYFVEVESTNGNYIGVYANGAFIDWETALEYCEEVLGVTLASVHNAVENAEASAVARAAGVTNYAWFGLNDIAVEGTFVYTDGTSFDFSVWRASNPDNFGTGEDCTHWWVNEDTWNDLPCDDTSIVDGFVCNAPDGTNAPTEEPTAEPQVVP